MFKQHCFLMSVTNDTEWQFWSNAFQTFFTENIKTHKKCVEEQNHSMLKALEIAQFHKEKEPSQKNWTSTLENIEDQQPYATTDKFSAKVFFDCSIRTRLLDIHEIIGN